jgi:hypothetical protein
MPGHDEAVDEDPWKLPGATELESSIPVRRRPTELLTPGRAFCERGQNMSPAPVFVVLPVDRRFSADHTHGVCGKRAVLVPVKLLPASVSRAQIIPGDRIVRADVHLAWAFTVAALFGFSRVTVFSPAEIVHGAPLHGGGRLIAAVHLARGCVVASVLAVMGLT